MSKSKIKPVGTSNISGADRRLLGKLGEMHEDDFTKRIMKPLFSAMGYERVEFYGGSHEKGKDLIATRKIPPRVSDYVVLVQSKRFKGTEAAKEAKIISTLLHQLRQCALAGIDRGDGRLVFPNEIYLASPNIVSQRVRDELAGQLTGLRPEVTIYDGVDVILGIRQFAPELLRLLSTLQERLTSIETLDASNSELIRALSSQNAPDITQLYRDLSFFVGSVDSNVLLHLEVSVESKPQFIESSRWTDARRQVEEIAESFGIYILTESFEQINERFSRQLKAFECPSNQASIKLLATNRRKIEEAIQAIEQHLHAIESAELNRTGDRARRREVDRNPKMSREANESLMAEASLVRDLLRSGSLEQCQEQIKSGEITNINIQSVLLEVSCVFELKEQVSRLVESVVPPPKVEVLLDRVKVVEHIKVQRQKYFDGVLGLSRPDRSRAGIASFLSETEETLGFIASLRSKTFEFNEAFSFEISRLVEDRVSISPHEVLESGRNVAVYGGAGVGKTTTLKAYVSKCIAEGRNNVVYVPLNRVTEQFVNMRREFENRSSLVRNEKSTPIQFDDQIERFEDGLLAKIVLASRGLQIDSSNLREASDFLGRGITLVLDGLDEIFDTLKEILPAIATFTADNPKSQLIVSSRDCVSYLSSIRFLGITLLPFTKDQLKFFVRGWVSSSNKCEEIIRAIDTGGLYEHIRTPLLATIACSLAEKGIRVVSNERDIYFERLRLLTGAYDHSKGIRRQTQTSELLISVARRLAFELHDSRSRSLPWDKLLKTSQRAMGRRMEAGLVERALRELIDPCNVLVLDQDTQEIGFGHFRFQEHLVSEEFALNREIHVAMYSGSDWWRGAICLYAQQVDAETLFREVFETFGQIGQALRTLRAIVLEAAPSDRDRLRAALSLYLNADRFDASVFVDRENYSDPFGSDDIRHALGLTNFGLVD